MKNSALSFLVVLLLALANQMFADSFLTNSLMLHFPFNANAQDDSGNGHHGIVTSAMPTTDRFGMVNRAYYFNGINAFIRIPNDASLNLTKDFTLSLWILQTSGGMFRILDKKTEGAAYTDGWILDVGYPKDFTIRFAGGSPVKTIMADNPYTPNVWHHIAVVYTAGYITNYLDGKINGSGAYGPNPTNSLDLYIGRAHPNTVTPKDFFFHGSIDDFRIYNRALTDTELKGLFQFETKPLPQVSIERAIRFDAYMEIGKRYQIEYSYNLIDWFSSGTSFVATNSYESVYFNVTESEQYWRLFEF